MPRLLQPRAAVHEPELRAAADGEVPECTLLQRGCACVHHQGCVAVGWAAHEWRKTLGSRGPGCACEDGWGCPGGLACSLLEQNVERVCLANLALLQGRFQLLATGRRGELVDVDLDGDGDVELDAIALRRECTDTSGSCGHGSTARCERTRARRGQESPSCREHGPSCQTVLSERACAGERIAGRIEKQLWDGVGVIFRQQCRCPGPFTRLLSLTPAQLRHPPCRDTAVVPAAVSDVPPRAPGVLPRRRAGGGGAECEGLGLIALLLELLRIGLRAA